MHDILYHRHHLDSVSDLSFYFFSEALLFFFLSLEWCQFLPTSVFLFFSYQYDHLEFPGVVPRTFIGAFIVSVFASPVVSIISCLGFPKVYSLVAARLVLGCIILSTLRFFRIQIKKKFGNQVETFFVLFTSLQFHFLFYCTRPLPNILALGLGNYFYSSYSTSSGPSDVLAIFPMTHLA